jgi:hypothetical protein
MSNLNGPTGIGAQLRLALFAESELNLAIESFGRGGLDRAESCTLIMTGAAFLYEIKIDDGYIFVAVALMDNADEPERLFVIGDTTNGWQTVQSFCMALESSGLRSLQPRPCDIGLDMPGGGFALL